MMKDKMPGLAILISKANKKTSMHDEGYEQSEGDVTDDVEMEEVKMDAGQQLIDALDRKDASAVFDAVKTLVNLC